MTHQKVLDFWFKKNSKKWFLKSSEFDKEIRESFLPLYEEIKSGKKESWEKEPQSLLAMIIVLDQFSRNMFRNTAEMFEADHQALVLSKKSILNGFDLKLSPEERVFIYLPFEHSENIEDQEDSIKFFTALHAENEFLRQALDYAIQHYKIIKRFGRFPHRNKILNRKSTEEETEFLKEEGSSF